jgi:hypothetical protein
MSRFDLDPNQCPDRWWLIQILRAMGIDLGVCEPIKVEEEDDN